MTLLKILIVDDEVLVRVSIIKRLEKLKFGFALIGEAENGKAAQRYIAENNPDIVLTDIRMPVLSGLDLIKQCLEEKVTAKFIVVSGYEDFSYAKEALTLGVVDYLLKPVTLDSLESAIKKCIALIHSERETASVIDEHIFLKRRLSALEFEKRLCESVCPTFKLDMTQAVSSSVTLDDSGTLYAIALLVFIPNNSSGSPADDLSLQSASAFVRQRLDNRLKGKALFLKDIKNPNDFPILLVGAGNGIFDILSDELTGILHSMAHSAIRFLCGVSEISPLLERKLYLQAQAAFEGRYKNAASALFFFDSNKPASGQQKMRLEYMEQIIQEHDIPQLKKLVDMLFLANEGENLSDAQIRAIFLRLSELLRPMFEDSGIGELLWSSDEISQNSFILSHPSYSSFADDIRSKIMLLPEAQRCFDAAYQDIPFSVKSYITQNFTKSFNLSDLAAKFNINASYLSTHFKKIHGEGIVTFTNRLRIERACSLLNKTFLSIEEISDKVGFSDYRYFVKVFKSITGLTPSAYRNPCDCNECQRYD